MRIKSLYKIVHVNGHYRAEPKDESMKHGQPEEDFIAKHYKREETTEPKQKPFMNDQNLFVKTMENIKAKMRK